MITIGSITREAAAARFPFLENQFSGRRKAIRDLTHRDPEFVFWIFPDGRLHDARRSHRDNVPKGYDHILGDEPDYCGFLRGRVVRLDPGPLREMTPSDAATVAPHCFRTRAKEARLGCNETEPERFPYG